MSLQLIMEFSRQEYWRVAIPFSRVSNPVLLHCRQILYCLRHQGSPKGVTGTLSFRVIMCVCVCMQALTHIFSSVQFSHLVMSDSVTPLAAAHQASLFITNSWSLLSSCPSSWWCRPTISSSVVPFSSRLQSFPASGSFPVSQFFASGGHKNLSSTSVPSI